MNKNKTDCLLCGVGGQGTVLASRLIAFAAMSNGQMARTAETIGMAQRGGCVVSHVRTGDTIFSPMIPLGSADIIIGFEPAEAVRCLPYLKKGGAVVTAKKGIMPVTATLNNGYDPDAFIDYLKANCANLVVVDGEKICDECGSTKALNIALLGAAVQLGGISLTLQDIENAITERVNPKFHELNLKALKLGAQCV